MPDILRPEPERIGERSRWDSPQRQRARLFVLTLSVAGCFGFLLWGFNEFTSLRAVVHVLASRIVLAGMWIAGVLLVALLAGAGGRRWRRIIVSVCAVMWAVLLCALDWWAPKPKIPSISFPLITAKIHPSAFPVSVAPRSTLYILPIHPYQVFNDPTSELHEFDNSCGEDHSWPTQEEINSKAANAYEEVRRIEVTNHGSSTLESGQMVFSVLYNDSFGGGCVPPPASSVVQKDVISIPTLDSGKTFEFVAVNQTNRCAWLLPPETIRVKMATDESPIDAPLKLEPINVPNWVSSPFGTTAVKWVGVPIKNPGYGIVRSGAKCESPINEEQRRIGIQKRLAVLINDRTSIRDKWLAVMGTPEDQQRPHAVEVRKWHSAIKRYLTTIPRGSLYVARFQSATRTDFGYPVGLNMNVGGNWDLLVTDLGSLNKFMSDPDLGRE